jgi:hypothetical protein
MGDHNNAILEQTIRLGAFSSKTTCDSHDRLEWMAETDGNLGRYRYDPSRRWLDPGSFIE